MQPLLEEDELPEEVEPEEPPEEEELDEEEELLVEETQMKFSLQPLGVQQRGLPPFIEQVVEWSKSAQPVIVQPEQTTSPLVQEQVPTPLDEEEEEELEEEPLEEEEELLEEEEDCKQEKSLSMQLFSGVQHEAMLLKQVGERPGNEQRGM